MCADALRLFGHDERLSQGATISLLTLLSRFFDIECKFNNCQLKFKIKALLYVITLLFCKTAKSSKSQCCDFELFNYVLYNFLIMYYITLGLDLESVAKAADVVVEYTTNTEDEYA